LSKIREQRIERIEKLAKQNGGMITTSQIEEEGISRVLIPTFIDEGILVKESRGIYYYADEFPDELQVIHANNPKLVYSYGTALYLWDMNAILTWNASTMSMITAYTYDRVFLQKYLPVLCSNDHLDKHELIFSFL